MSQFIYLKPNPNFCAIWGCKPTLNGRPIPVGSKIIFVQTSDPALALNRPERGEGLIVSWPEEFTANGITVAAGEPFMRHCPIYGKDPTNIDSAGPGPIEGDEISIIVILPSGLVTVRCRETFTWSHQMFIDLSPLTAIPADLNADGTVDIGDLQTMIDYLRGADTTGKWAQQIGDLNRDGTVDIGDLMVLADSILGFPRVDAQI